MFGIILALVFGAICLCFGFYSGYLLADNKSLKTTLDQYAIEDARYELERKFDDPD